MDYLGNVQQIWEHFSKFGILSQTIFNSSLSVDSFFLLSGTIVGYNVHSQIIRRKSNSMVPVSFKSIILFYVHRIVRLMPTYIFTFAFMYCIFQYIGDGPMWSQERGKVIMINAKLIRDQLHSTCV